MELVLGKVKRFCQVFQPGFLKNAPECLPPKYWWSGFSPNCLHENKVI